MTKITAEELLKEINEFRTNFDDSRTWREYLNELDPMLDKIPVVIEAITPTFDEVVKAWARVTHYNVMQENGFVIVGDCMVGGYVFASINVEKGIFDIPSDYDLDLHNAINLTIRYLESQKEKEND